MNKTIWDQCAEMWELPIEEVSALERKYYNYTNSDECQLWETAKKILNQHEHRKQIEAQKAAESEARLATLEKCVTIMNEWREQSLRSFFVDVPVSAGSHTVTVDYLELGGVSAVKVWWERR